MDDNDLDNLMRDLHYIDSGWHRIENPENGKVGLFPSVPVHAQGSAEARAAEDAWEARALKMHSAQKTITLPSKPEDRSAFKRIQRGD